MVSIPMRVGNRCGSGICRKPPPLVVIADPPLGRLFCCSKVRGTARTGTKKARHGGGPVKGRFTHGPGVRQDRTYSKTNSPRLAQKVWASSEPRKTRRSGGS